MYNASPQTRYRKRLYLRWRPLGCCVKCGTECGRNPVTGKPFAQCLVHRAREANYYRRKVKASKVEKDL